MKSIKKHSLSFLAFAFFIFLALGSDDTKNDSSSNGSTGETSIPNKEIVYNVGDNINVGNFTYRVNGSKYMKSISDGYTSTKADGIFLIINLSLVNNDKQEHTIDNSMYKLTDASGTEFESSSEGSTALEMNGNETLFLKQCNPKITKSGFLIFEVPNKAVYDLHLSGGFWSGTTAVVRIN